MRGQLERLFLREKPVLALIAVDEMDNAYAALIAKRINSTVPHTSSIFRELEEQGLIKSRPEGRINYLELTARGKSIAKILRELSELLNKKDETRLRLEKLQQMVYTTGITNASLRLGPLRRDLAKLKNQGDQLLRTDAEELDRAIASILSG
ncbi:MAG: hypothetical protein A4E49_03472 [Methanosaeta sp. PtaU1.Bin112]|nr:MAG: hypothetical protein A4E49_03472 [Methanosaeta sp. PtaU1.Bin112]